MLFKNANIFVGGKFRHGSFRAENGRFTEILTTVPAEGGIDLNDQYVIPGLVDVHNQDRKSTRLNSSHSGQSRMPSSA